MFYILYFVAVLAKRCVKSLSTIIKKPLKEKLTNVNVEGKARSSDRPFFKNIPLGVCILVITLGMKKFFLEFKSQGSA